MNKLYLFSLSLVLLFVLLTYALVSQYVSVAVAKNNETVCAGSYSGTAFDGDLVVPKGQTCTIGRFNVVNGDINVREGANLIICPDNDIRGGIKANRPNSVFISDQLIGPCAPLAPPPKALGITIAGDVRVENGGSFTLLGNPLGIVAVSGDVEIKKMQTVEILQFTVNGDVAVKQSKDVTVTGNIIGGDLKIKGTSGTCVEQSNSVTGKVDSCP